MRSNDDSLTPDASRELAAVDAALAGEPVPADLAELGQLVVALRDDRPAPREQFAHELDALAGAGFERGPEPAAGASATGAPPPPRPPGPATRSRPRLSLPRPPRSYGLALGAAASLFIVATAVISSGVLSGGDGDDRPVALQSPPADQAAPAVGRTAPSSPQSSPGGPALESAPSASKAPGDEGSAAAGDSTIAPSPPAPRQRAIAPRARERKVERQAALTLAAAPNEVEDVADDVIRVTDRYRGFVLSSTVSGGDDGEEGATLDLRIPSSRLQPAIADLSGLAHVRSRTQSAQDVTATFVSLRSRLRDALAERKALLRQLARADTPSELASVRAQLRLANRRIARVRASLGAQRNRVDFSAVTVAIEADRDAASREDNGTWTLGDALDDAVSILGTAAGVLLIALAVVLPLALVGVLAGATWRRSRRRQRERALDESGGIANEAAR